jgi:hypothetical protein
MGRKHKNNSLKYILRSNEDKINKLTKENEQLIQSNDCLQKMANYSMSRSMELQKKIEELEEYTKGIMEITRVQKDANDFQKQKIKILETQLSLFTTPAIEEPKSFSRTMALTCSVKVDKIESKPKKEDKTSYMSWYDIFTRKNSCSLISIAFILN